MTGKLGVHLAWGDGERPVGRLLVPKGRDAVLFQYEESWLDDPLFFDLDPALTRIPSPQHPADGHALFGFLSDISPDRWGRDLMRMCENRDAENRNRKSGRMGDADFLLRVWDGLRMGGLRIRDEDGYVAPGDAGIPPVIGIAAFHETIRRIECGKPVTGRELRDILGPAASLGGSRPKGSFLDTGGAVIVAKFPKRSDRFDIPLWEKVSLDMARDVGIRTPESRLERLPDGRHALLVERFDRTGKARIPMASAMTLVGAWDDDRGRHSYFDVLEILERDGGDFGSDARELWTRMMFNILTSNRDDHLRNHAFLRENDGWRLSPVYDLESDALKAEHCIAIDAASAAPSPSLGLRQAEFYGVSRETARETMERMLGVVRDWRKYARRLGAAGRDIPEVAGNFAAAESFRPGDAMSVAVPASAGGMATNASD
jgi:serine/threonine-protein kinase HipA